MSSLQAATLPPGRPAPGRLGPVTSGPLATASSWLGGAGLGMALMALVVGVCSGFGAVFFRWLIFAFTWIVTGYTSFGAQGRVLSLHLPWLGIWFLLLVPVLGGLLYGPLIDHFAPEARGHGVPEVMVAVAENGGRIRPQVTVVKALASAICIGVGGSVGREGPIVQIGSALASSLGQFVHMPESRLRVLVACGAAGGISATFNAPITGLFFGFELILREFSLDALFAIILSSMMADVIGRAFFGAGPIFSQVPHNLVLGNDWDYLLVGLLGLIAALLGVGFKTLLYGVEDVCDGLWESRPEWLRPAVGGIALGALLLAVPQLYGVGYPVIEKAVAGQYVLWFLVALVFAKMLATSLSIGIGGSGGVFAPSLFIGAAAGMAFGAVASHIFGPAVGPPAVYAVIAMGAVFAAAAQAPLTSIASVVEMTGNFTLTLPVMLAIGIAAGLSRVLTQGTIYTTKLLRRGTDIDRPRPANVFQLLTVADAMQALSRAGAGRSLDLPGDDGSASARPGKRRMAAQLGRVRRAPPPQVLFGDEKLEDALRQLTLFGPDGLPVVSSDEGSVVGWITRADVIQTLANRLAAAGAEVAGGTAAAKVGSPDPMAEVRVPPAPLDGYQLLKIQVGSRSPYRDLEVAQVSWPTGWIPVAITIDQATSAARDDTVIRAGGELLVLAPATSPRTPSSE